MRCHGRLDLPPSSINKMLSWRASPAMPPLNQQFNDIFLLDVIAMTERGAHNDKNRRPESEYPNKFVVIAGLTPMSLS